MNPHCLGSVPQNFGIAPVAEVSVPLLALGPLQPVRTGHAELVLDRCRGRARAKAVRAVLGDLRFHASVLQPSLTFSLSPAYITQNITSENSSLLPSQFYVCQPNRPTLIVNTNLQENDLLVDPPQIPVQATARETGIAGQSPDGTIVGGGLVESFAFTSSLNGPGAIANTASVNVNRCYSLCDIAGCSSAFFAEYLLQYINAGIDDIVAELVKRYANRRRGRSRCWSIFSKR